MIQAQDTVIRDQNSKLLKARQTRDTAEARLQQQIESGASTESVMRAETSLQRATTTYNKAVKSSLELVGTGSGQHYLVLPQGTLH